MRSSVYVRRQAGWEAAGELKAGWFVSPQLEAAPPGVRGHGGT